jgi:hypothetical protein
VLFTNALGMGAWFSDRTDGCAATLISDGTFYPGKRGGGRSI